MPPTTATTEIGAAGITMPTVVTSTSAVTLHITAIESSNTNQFVTIVTSMVPVTLTATRTGQAAESTIRSASLALPTIFTPPASCTAARYTLMPAGVDNITVANSSLTAVHGLQTPCFPSYNVFASGGTTITQPQTSYTPATCFQEYTAAISYVSDMITTATCCPLGWQASSSDCFVTRLTPASIVVISSDSTITTLSAALERASWHVVAWQFADRALWEPTESVPIDPTTSSTGGLSNAAKGGIGAGATALILIIAFIIGLYILEQRRQARSNAEIEEHPQKAELPGEGKQLPEFGDETALHETDGTGKPPEVDARATVKAELESDWTGWEAPALLEVELSRPVTEEDASENGLLRLAKSTKQKADGEEEEEEEEEAERSLSWPRDHY